MAGKDFWEKIREEKRPIVLYGISDVAEKLKCELKRIGVSISGIMVSDDFYREREFLGFKVKRFCELKKELGDFVILLCFGTDRQNVLEQIKDFEKESTLLAPDFPVIGEGLFTGQYYEENKQRFCALEKLLADEQSVSVLKHVINYKLSGELSYLYACESSAKENWRLALPADNLIDLGAYTGDTAALFENLNPDYKNIIAFEPGSRNFRKLCEYAKNKERIRCFNFAVSDAGHAGSFPSGSGRGKSTKKYESVDFVSLDGFLFREEPKRMGRNAATGGENGFSEEYAKEIYSGIQDMPMLCENAIIKMDIEGFEKEALTGASEIIKRYAPNLIIAGYHRLEDLLEIPDIVLGFYPDYKLYLRKGPGIPAWEINYIFIRNK